MRTLAAPPSRLLDPSTGQPAFGAYAGGLGRIDLRPAGRSALFRGLHHKRWLYALIAGEELAIGLAIVNLGYALKGFVFALDRRSGKLAVDYSAIAPRGFGEVADGMVPGAVFRFQSPDGAGRLSVVLGAAEHRVEVTAPELRVSARLRAAGAPLPLGVVAALGARGSGCMDLTEKGALLETEGEVTLRGERRSLEGAFAGYDYTQGYMPRHTRWRWAYGLGRAVSGERVALNLTQGFIGEPECVVWVEDDLVPTGEGRFIYEPARPLQPWRLRTDDGGVDLVFSPDGLHAETTNLGVIASSFVQPVGSFSGTVRARDGRTLELARLPGVVEDQDVLW